jgi:hypothetical protein
MRCAGAAVCAQRIARLAAEPDMPAAHAERLNATMSHPAASPPAKQELP